MCRASYVALAVKNLPAVAADVRVRCRFNPWVWKVPWMQVQSLGLEGSLEKGMAIHSNILAWRSPWTDELGGLQSMGLERVVHD